MLPTFFRGRPKRFFVIVGFILADAVDAGTVNLVVIAVVHLVVLVLFLYFLVLVLLLVGSVSPIISETWILSFGCFDTSTIVSV